MRVEELSRIITLLIGVVALVTSSAHASMGYAVVPVQGTPHDDSDERAVEALMNSKSYVEDPSGPTANFTVISETTLRYPNRTVTFQDTSTPGAAPIQTRTWFFGDGRGGHTFDGGNPIVYEYPERSFGTFTGSLLVTDTNGFSNRKLLSITIYRYTAPLPTDISWLNTLKAMTGMRAMIAQHPTRSSFVLGNGIYEEVWYDKPILHDCRPPIPQGGNDMDRDWTCGSSIGTYCDTDPLSYTADGYYLPTYSQDYLDYLKHEFNALHPQTSLMEGNIARKGVYNAQGTPPFVVYPSYDYLNRSVDYAIDNDMAVLATPVLYHLPAWAAYAARAGTLPVADYRAFLMQYTQNLIGYYTNPNNYHTSADKPRRFSYWEIANEVVADSGATSGNLENLLIWRNPQDFWPATDWTGAEAKYRHYYWPWFYLCNPQWNSNASEWEAQTPAGAANFLMEIYDANHAHAWDPNAAMVLNEYGVEFRWRSSNVNTPTIRVENDKYARLRSVLQHLRSGGSGPDVVALQAHLATWQFLTYDGSTPSGPQDDCYAHEDSLRVNLNQLKNVRDAIRGFTEPSEGGLAGLRALIGEIDLRMGIPHYPQQQYSTNFEWISLRAHLNYHTETWEHADESTLTLRQKWQGKALEAVMNACLVVPELDGIISWDWVDETSWLDTGNYYGSGSWPNTDSYPDEKASQPGIFGRNPATTDLTQRETFYPKPSYYGLRNAITNYFGPAFVIRSASGAEVMRFAQNGNVLLMTMPITGDTKKWYEHVHSPCSSADWAELATYTGTQFIVKDVQGQTKAAVTSAGDIYLAGNVYEDQTLSSSGGTAFDVQGADGEVVSQIDQEGNLRMQGYFLVGGLPFRWKNKETVDAYFSN